jgi:hypothetical protein
MSKPKARNEPTPERRPRSKAALPAAAEPAMSWRFEHIDLDGTWGWTTLDQADAEALHRELVELERDTRRKLEVENKLNRIPCQDLCSEAQQRLIDRKHEQWEDLWQLVLRSGGRDKWRAWGRAEGDHFYLLWWDPQHTVCSHGPAKGTAKHR